ncbi:MAG TPA: FAD-dependent oxidoreductase, partial [bacterium]|nr:FAD-dependent oxidoreductase [bacterium]
RHGTPAPRRTVPPMERLPDVIVVGAGIFGLAAALELHAGGRAVTVVDDGPLPRPLGASTDISKVVRIEYGRDEEYMALAERARDGWLRWNAEWFGEPLYHEVGLLLVSGAPMVPGDYLHDSYYRLLARGHRPERLSSADIAARWPAIRAGACADGYLNPEAGYVESGRVIEALGREAGRAGVAFHGGAPVRELVERSGRVTGVRLGDGTVLGAGETVLATGAWTPGLVPELAAVMRSVGQPVFHLAPADPAAYAAPRLPVVSADSARTGWYGFPAHPRTGVVKIANHGPGWPVDPVRDPRVVPEAYVPRLRAFLADTLPGLADAPIVYTRCCLYCDTPDEHFWIARHPGRAHLTVAAGDSGHGFKFGPVLGAVIADAVDGRANAYLDKFRWREIPTGTVGQEGSRYRGAG